MRFGTAGDPTTDGRYMIHCHNLPHEDHDMMTQYRVGKDDGSNDPLGAPPKDDPRPAEDPVHYPERYKPDPRGSVDA